MSGRRSTLLALAILATGCGDPSPDAATRVVLVTVDTWRLDGFTPELMPRTAAFAQRGLVFDQHYAASSVTQPTHASLFTGSAPWVHGVTRNGEVLNEGVTTLAEHLSRQGFSTHGIVASFPLSRRFGFAQGFDEYEDDFDELYVQVWEGEETDGGRFFSLAESVTERALGALDRARGERQFFWFHYFDPHDPYGDAGGGDAAGHAYPIQELLRLAGEGSPEIGRELERARGRYAEDLRALDRSLGRLFDRLAADEADFATHVLVTADHGESFGELGALGHGKRLTREQVQVPLVLVSPRVSPGRRGELGGSADVARTLLGAAGLPAGELGGRDLLLEGGSPSVFGMRRTFAVEEPRPELLADGRRRPLPAQWFYVVQAGELFSGNGDQVLREDDLARPVEGARAEELARAFGGLAELARAVSSTELLDPDTQAALRALGYGH